MKKVVILQSNYIPWKGYFDLIRDADLFVFYDDVQYTKNDWRNRNKLKTAQGPRWITIPVGIDANRLICEVAMRDTGWQKSHWDTIRQLYAKRPYFAHYRPFFEDVYLGREWHNLSALNHHLIQRISHDLLGITTRFDDSRHYQVQGQRLDRLLDLVVQTGATHYISGPAGANYIEPERFAALGVELQFKSYAGYPEYPQDHPPFEHGVTILDLLFNVGPSAPEYIWGWREKAVAA